MLIRQYIERMRKPCGIIPAVQRDLADLLEKILSSEDTIPVFETNVVQVPVTDLVAKPAAAKKPAVKKAAAPKPAAVKPAAPAPAAVSSLPSSASAMPAATPASQS